MQAHSAQDPAAVALEGIVAATETMNQSITTMLAVARSTYGTEQRCTSSELLAQALERAPRSASVTVRVDVEEGSAPLLIAAPEQVVNAALAPLVDNAVRHASSTVRLSARRQGRSVLILIEDDGDGVTDEELERIFEPGESSAAERSGLGLALARRLARSVGGEVHALGGAHGRFALDLPAV
jgi:signal transduction histidine kinase